MRKDIDLKMKQCRWDIMVLLKGELGPQPSQKDVLGVFEGWK